MHHNFPKTILGEALLYAFQEIVWTSEMTVFNSLLEDVIMGQRNRLKGAKNDQERSEGHDKKL